MGDTDDRRHVPGDEERPFFAARHTAFRQRVREFFRREVVPYAEQWERDRRIPADVWRRMGAEGLLGVNYPASCGGAELDLRYSLVLLEELGRTGFGGFRAAVSVHQYMALAYVHYRGSPWLKDRYLRAAITGEKVAALAITEPLAGSDVARLSTAAVRDGGDFVLRGEKAFVTSGTTFGFLVVAARTSQRGAHGLSLFVVDADSPGLNAKPVETVGWRCSDVANITLNDVRVPLAHLIGDLDCGFHYIMHCMQMERLVAATLAVGEMDLCLEQTVQYIRGRAAFGGRLSHLQSLRHRLADLATDVEAARALVYAAARLFERGDLPILQCSMAKLKATELAKTVVDTCLQLHGGHGYTEGHLIARMYRDIRATTLAGGASEVMREVIAQMMID